MRLGALARAPLRTVRAQVRFYEDLGVQRGFQRGGQRHERGPSGGEVKLHVAPLGGALAWVSAHSAL